MAIVKSAFLPRAPVSSLKMEKIGLAVAFVSDFPSEELFVQLKSYRLGKHRI